MGAREYLHMENDLKHTVFGDKQTFVKRMILHTKLNKYMKDSIFYFICIIICILILWYISYLQFRNDVQYDMLLLAQAAR